MKLARWPSLFLLLFGAHLPAQDGAAFFEKKVRPVLVKHCYSCHGPEKQRGGLRLDSLEAIKKGGELGPALVQGKPDESRLVSALRYKGDLKMPPKGKLPDAVVNDLAAWVKMGAPWTGAVVKVPGTDPPGTTEKPLTTEEKNFWAFRPVVAVAPPAVRDVSWPANPIDHFILAKLEAKGLKPARPADRRTLIRRLTFDLTGMPPSPQEVEEFLKKAKPQAAEELVERLLASPAYGERWGRRWLDVARYADSNGMDENLAQANAWRYRDYVIDAFNRDRPYRDFVRDQIAGDLLRPGDPEGIVATGFLSLGPKMLAEDDPVKMQMDIVDEQIDAVGQAFLGLTLGCARCHDHKFDPLSQRDYYGLAGIFKSTKTMNTFSVVAQWHERPLTTPEVTRRLAEIEKQLSEKRALLAAQENEARQRLQAQARLEAARYVEAAEELRRQSPLRSFMSDPKKAKPAGALVIEAEDYQRGNALKSRTGYGEGIGVIYNAGTLPNVAEYDVRVPAARTYQLEIRYAAAEARPIEVHLNRRQVRDGVAGRVTGSWNPDTQSWHVEGVLSLRAGKNVLRLERKLPFPHIDKFALVPLSKAPRTAEDLADERKLNPLFLRQWLTYLEKSTKLPVGAELQRLTGDPQGPFAVSPQLEGYFPDETRTKLRTLRGEITKLEKVRPAAPSAIAVSEGKTENVRVHIRGNHLTLGPEAPRRFPRVLAGEQQRTLPAVQSGRLELAEWLTRDDHPLTARVMVNRLWLGHFGEGLVRSADNFGNLGDRPAHPELLDWLADYFIRSGWSMKAMHRLILSSRTYQMSTAYDEKAALLDPDNRLHWRFERRRLEAEAMRDSLLAVSGSLERQMGGTIMQVRNRAYVTSTANRSYEGYDHAIRSVYLPVIRSEVYEVFQAFDFADPSTLTGRRPTTTVAPQALFMMNGKFMQEQTRKLAERLLALPNPDDTERVRQLFERAYSRPPQETETRRALDFLSRYQQAGAARAVAWQALCRVVLSSNEFVYVE